MVEQVAISGQIGKAIFQEEGRYFQVGAEDLDAPVECRSGDMALFFNSRAEFTTFPSKGATLSDIKEALESDRRNHRALSLSIAGMDSRLTTAISC